MKTILFILTLLCFSFTGSEYQISGIYLSQGKGRYFEIENMKYKLSNISGDNAAVICSGNILIKQDTLFFMNRSANKASFIFCDSLEFAIIKSDFSFIFKDEIFERKQSKKCKKRGNSTR